MQNIEQVMGFLNEQGLILATAESCTAGLIASLVADVPGSGSVMECGYVVYAVRAKNTILGVSLETVDTYGLTSEEVAREMALGALERSGANIVLANTGMAESDNELDGVICFACAMKVNGQPRMFSETVRFDGERNEVRRAAARHALLSLDRYVAQLRHKQPV